MSLLKRYEIRLNSEGKTRKSKPSYMRMARWIVQEFEEPEKITKSEMLDFLDRISQQWESNNTTLSYVSCINHFAGFLELGFKLKGPRSEEKVTIPLKEEEVAAMIEAAEHNREELTLRDKAVLVVLAEGALRAEAVTNLLLEDVNFDRGHIVHRKPKGKVEKPVYLPEHAMEAIARYIEVRPTEKGGEDKHLFLSSRRKKLDETTIREIVKLAAARAGIKRNVYPHLLRHTKLTSLAEAGKSPFAIKEFAQHRSLNTTMKYVHYSDEKVRSEILSAPLLKAEDRKVNQADMEDLRQKLAARLALGEIDQEAFERALLLLGYPDLESLR